MRVAFDISPLKAEHSYRGIGSYTQNLKSALSLQKTSFQIDFVESSENLYDYDLIHYPYFDIFFHTLPIHSKNKRVVTIHDVIPLVFPSHFPSGIKGNINLFLQKLALKNVSKVISDSKTSALDISNKLSYPQSSISTIYLAAGKNFRKISDKKILSNVSKKYNLPPQFCLYVGDVNWNKNLEGLVNAIAIAKQPAVLVGKAIVNNEIPQTIALNKLISDLGIEKLIVKTGYVPESDLVSIYNLAQVTIQPSFYEGFGLSVVESMSCGTPVICSNNSSLAEIIEGKTVFICDPREPSDIADKIIRVFKISGEERTTLSKRLIGEATNYSWDEVARQTISVYKEVLGLK